jgi:hypothetical protein
LSINIRKFGTGIGLVPVSSSSASLQGELEVQIATSKLHYHNGTILSAVVTESTLATLSIATSQLSGQVSIANGGTGQATQQLALNAIAGSVTAAQFLRGNGTNVVMSAIQASDVPTLNQNTTGTAANITATSNSTLTTLSALALPASQITGSLPGAQVSGNISGNAANVTGTVAIANGGTGQVTATAAFNALSPITSTGDLIIGN